MYLSALGLSSAQNEFDTVTSSSGGLSATNQADGDVPGRGNLTSRVNRNLRAGGALTLNLANDLLRCFSGDPRTSASSVLTVNVLKPLLRGAGNGIASENLTQASRDVIYAVRDFSTFQDEFSTDIVIQYLRLLEQQESVKNEYNNYLSRKKNTEYLRARSVDRAKPQEVSDSEQDELLAKNRWVNAKSRYQTSLDDFKLTLGLPAVTKLSLDPSELDRLRKAGLQSLGLTETSAFKFALKHRLPLMNDVDRFDDSKRQVLVAADRLRTQVDFVSRASLRSTDDRLDKFNLNNLSTSVGIELDLPINRRSERNQYRSSLIRFEASIRSLTRSFDSLNNLIVRRIREVNQFEQNYEIQKGAVELAERRVEGNKLRFQAGTLIFRRLSESQDALIAAQNAVTAALIDYQSARLALFNDIGILDTTQSNYWLKQNPTKK